jgi:hypothetical protein
MKKPVLSPGPMVQTFALMYYTCIAYPLASPKGLVEFTGIQVKQIVYNHDIAGNNTADLYAD